MQIVLAIILGALFGAVLYWVGASSPKKLIAMLRLEDLTLMKIIVFGIGFASALLSLFGLLGWFNVSHLSVKATNLGVVLGGLLFGIGFGTVGTCPGTCVICAHLVLGHCHEQPLTALQYLYAADSEHAVDVDGGAGTLGSAEFCTEDAYIVLNGKLGSLLFGRGFGLCLCFSHWNTSSFCY